MILLSVPKIIFIQPLALVPAHWLGTHILTPILAMTAMSLVSLTYKKHNALALHRPSDTMALANRQQTTPEWQRDALLRWPAGGMALGRHG